MDTTAPTRPSQIAASSFSNPGRATPEPDPTEIVVDDADIGPTELSGALDESILAPAAFDVVDHLTDR
jgi:hypothetical protein